ncbi:MAG: asparagine synthetase B family protein [Bacteroidales bacterium]
MAFAPDAIVDRRVVCAMTTALAHRGPSGGGHHFAPGIGLGYRQLFPGDDNRPVEPATNEDGTVRLVGDLALTNARELAAELGGLGHRICGRVPADVLPHAYEEWGDDFVHRLRGAFACAVWDARRRRLLLARDALGVKPLFYAATGAAISFASEIKGLLQDPEIPHDCDAAALQEYLALQYVPAPATVLRAVAKLPAGHIAIAEGDGVSVRRYWDLPRADHEGRRDSRERLVALARDAVRVESQNDTDPTLMLSGGQASAIVGAILADTRPAPVVTVTTAVGEAPFTQLAQAHEVAKAIGSRHHTQLSMPRLADLLPRLAWHLDEPFASPSALEMYLACAATRQYAERALAGGGGRQVMSALPRWSGGALRRARLAMGGNAAREAAPGLRGWRRLRRALHPEFVTATCWTHPLDGLRALSAGCGSRRRVERDRYLQVKVLPDAVIAPLDRLSAAVSLEVRLPFLDRRFVEGLVAAPMRPVDSRRGGAWLSPRALPKAMTPATAGAMEGRIAAWLRGPLAPMMSDVLLGGRFRQRGLFDHRAVTRLWQQHLTGRRDHHAPLWSMLMLELWLEHFIDSASVAARAA